MSMVSQSAEERRTERVEEHGEDVCLDATLCVEPVSNAIGTTTGERNLHLRSRSTVTSHQIRELFKLTKKHTFAIGGWLMLWKTLLMTEMVARVE